MKFCVASTFPRVNQKQLNINHYHCHMGTSVNVVNIMFEEVKTIPLEKNISDDDDFLLELHLLCYTGMLNISI